MVPIAEQAQAVWMTSAAAAQPCVQAAWRRSPFLCQAHVHVGEDVGDAACQHVVEACVLL